ncbi:hypothetical protein AVEN_266507-1 [Araneus ventricosus]|uniref:Uncharacterized protein n=1 Tax=Araneus ventricosus TaxID=182803 RepID=A0A4Y2I3R5_ARAVE|nr:hypothetical protein AVEN_266507-1 [Araneus ventricosus]
MYPNLLAVRGDPLDGWYLSVPSVSIGQYPSHLAGLLKGSSEGGHSLDLALRVFTIPGGRLPAYRFRLASWQMPRLEIPEPVTAIPCRAPWWTMPSDLNLDQCLMDSLSFVVEANSYTLYMLINTPNTFHTVPLRGTSSSGVTGFTTPRYPSVCSPSVFVSP